MLVAARSAGGVDIMENAAADGVKALQASPARPDAANARRSLFEAFCVPGAHYRTPIGHP